jgi:hypothetical protein
MSLYSIIEAPYNIVPSWGLPPTEDNANPASHAHIKCIERDMLQSRRLHEFFFGGSPELILLMSRVTIIMCDISQSQWSYRQITRIKKITRISCIGSMTCCPESNTCVVNSDSLSSMVTDKHIGIGRIWIWGYVNFSKNTICR